MIYLDSSVALGHILAEDRRPGTAFWSDSLIASRLLEYEIWTRLNNLRLEPSAKEAARMVVQRVGLLELIPEIAGRARDGFPVPVRTLDGLHLASAMWLIGQGIELQLATYDQRMQAAAKRLKIPLYRGLSGKQEEST